MEEDATDSTESESNLTDFRTARDDVFSFFRSSMRNISENTSANNSNVDSEEVSVEISLEPDEDVRTLPCEHQYLGELEQVRGRVIMDDGSIQKIPLLFPASQVTLVPGQSFPLFESEEITVNILKYSLESDHIFGIIPSVYWNPRSSLKNMVGTTAEIIACSHSNNGYKVKAVGRQRFKVLRIVSELINESYITFAYIKILPEIVLKPVLDGVHLPSLNKFRTSQSFNILLSLTLFLRCLKRDACQMRWPIWIYRNYDEKYLIENVKSKLTENVSISKNILFSDDPTTLSFQLLKHVPIPQKLILEAMELNSPIQRLRWFMNILNSQTDKLKCITCRTTIGSCADIFAMSIEGPHGTYVNSEGCVHELITLKTVTNTFPSSDPETEYSWFPGYAWSVAYCCECHHHIGWMFTACKKGLKPYQFWGIKSSSVEAKYAEDIDRT
ncbi:hypothetical protein PGB90_004197 [Kerria lacca]